MGVHPRQASGHVFRRRGPRGDVWGAKYRLPDGRQVQRKIGPAWSERGRPAEGYFTKRTAEAWLEEVLHEARRGVLPGMVRTGATFAGAAAEWLRYVEQERGRKPSTVADYRCGGRGPRPTPFRGVGANTVETTDSASKNTAICGKRNAKDFWLS